MGVSIGQSGAAGITETPAMLYASLQIQLLAELETNVSNAKKFQD
jgi:hypothetical protein